MTNSLHSFAALLLMLTSGVLTAQPDTIIVYTIKTHKIDTILPQPFNASITFTKTNASIGTLGNQALLSLTPPTVNLFPGSDFCDIAKASNAFSLGNYPIRTAVALRYYRGDSAATGCSGIMVAPGFALSAGHCIYKFATQTFSYYDSLKICPAFNNGTEHPNVPGSFAKRIYIFKTYYDQTGWDDVSLIELEEPIGLQTGWVGIGFDSNPANYAYKVFHKFSYPARPNPLDPTKIYNGDTLYYNYGYISDFSNYLGVPGSSGVQGQSGSSFLYTDNTDYYSVGVMNFSNNYLHYKLNNAAFFGLQNILQNTPMGINDADGANMHITAYPNPFADKILIDLNEKTETGIRIYNALGQTVCHTSTGKEQHIQINTSAFENGIYFIQVSMNNQTYSAGKFIKN